MGVRRLRNQRARAADPGRRGPGHSSQSRPISSARDSVGGAVAATARRPYFGARRMPCGDGLAAEPALLAVVVDREVDLPLIAGGPHAPLDADLDGFAVGRDL